MQLVSPASVTSFLHCNRSETLAYFYQCSARIYRALFALRRQVGTGFADSRDLDEENKQLMLKLLAFENANSKTKSLLTTLPQGAEVGEMLELAHQADQSDQGRVVAQAVAEAIKPTTNMITAAVQKVGSKNSSKAADICYRCGAKGHHRKACHATVWCNRCQKGNHA